MKVKIQSYDTILTQRNKIRTVLLIASDKEITRYFKNCKCQLNTLSPRTNAKRAEVFDGITINNLLICSHHNQAYIESNLIDHYLMKEQLYYELLLNINPDYHALNRIKNRSTFHRKNLDKLDSHQNLSEEVKENHVVEEDIQFFMEKLDAECLKNLNIKNGNKKKKNGMVKNHTSIQKTNSEILAIESDDGSKQKKNTFSSISNSIYKNKFNDSAANLSNSKLMKSINNNTKFSLDKRLELAEKLLSKRDKEARVIQKNLTKLKLIVHRIKGGVNHVSVLSNQTSEESMISTTSFFNKFDFDPIDSRPNFENKDGSNNEFDFERIINNMEKETMEKEAIQNKKISKEFKVRRANLKVDINLKKDTKDSYKSKTSNLVNHHTGDSNHYFTSGLNVTNNKESNSDHNVVKLTSKDVDISSLTGLSAMLVVGKINRLKSISPSKTITSSTFTKDLKFEAEKKDADISPLKMNNCDFYENGKKNNIFFQLSEDHMNLSFISVSQGTSTYKSILDDSSTTTKKFTDSRFKKTSKLKSLSKYQINNNTTPVKKRISDISPVNIVFENFENPIYSQYDKPKKKIISDLDMELSLIDSKLSNNSLFGFDFKKFTSAKSLEDMENNKISRSNSIGSKCSKIDLIKIKKISECAEEFVSSDEDSNKIEKDSDISLNEIEL